MRRGRNTCAMKTVKTLRGGSAQAMGTAPMGRRRCHRRRREWCAEGEGGRTEAGSGDQKKACTAPQGLPLLWRRWLDRSRKLQGGLSPTARALTDSTHMAGLKSAPQGVDFQTRGRIPRGGSDDTTNRTAGRGVKNYPTNGDVNRRRIYRVGEEKTVDPPTTRGDRPGTPGGSQGTQIDKGGGRTDGDEGSGGGRPPTTRGIGPGTPGGPHRTQGT